MCYTEFNGRSEHNGFAYTAEIGFVAPLPAGLDLEVYSFIGEKEIDYNGYTKYHGYIDEVLISKDVTKNLFVGFSVWQPFVKVTDKYKQWDDIFSETNYYTEVNSTSYLLNVTYFFKSGKKINKVKKESFMESNSNDKKIRRR